MEFQKFYYIDINNDVKEITFENSFFYGSYDESDKTFYDIQRGKRVRYYLTPECNDQSTN